MEKHKKLALQDLIAKKMQREQDKTEYKPVYIDELGGSILVKKIPVLRVMEMMDARTDDSMVSNVEFNVDLAYAACDIFHEKELQEAFRAAEPTDVVLAVLDDNIGALSDICAAILSFYGLADDITKTLKN